MSLNITLKDGNGAFYVNQSTKQNAPKLEGFVEFSLDGEKDGPKLRLDAAAWTKDKDGLAYYSLSIGGLNGALFPEKEKKSAESPDYTGSVGPNRELRIVGWKRKAESNGEMYISLLISEPNRQGQRAPAAAGKEAAFI
ncbi:hypothetical protein [Methylibium petroleiphilum]|uniref:Uncharacterized protein n=1 Tax=Methylibium petroleiphilum (strain ATCC BAA-1232 / LMG 22953 / PM1) TaxID=420662 RepID=A2SMS1_METPP|nr:hypothetical protein [Methylibium petroleiphilum]ABM96860.1 hypothetical protein Mpe_B0081 [Methylibium petroleiphilum PM1]